MVAQTYPVFDRADWNEFSGGAAWVNVPLDAYEEFPFEFEVGDRCIIVENEEMTGMFGVIEEIHELQDEYGTPRFVKVRIDQGLRSSKESATVEP